MKVSIHICHLDWQEVTIFYGQCLSYGHLSNWLFWAETWNCPFTALTVDVWDGMSIDDL